MLTPGTSTAWGALVTTHIDNAMTERTFTPYDIQNCLYDSRRVEYFAAALKEVIKPGDVVADGGSGTGVLGLLAAKLGARTVYCVELNREYVGVIAENARLNGLSDQIRSIYGNAALLELPEPVDVIISEVISGGLFYEPQLQIVNNLRRFLKPGGIVIPGRMVNDVELISAQDEMYGLTFAYDTRHRALDDHALSSRTTYLDVDFGTSGLDPISADVCVDGITDGTANAIRVPYSLRFSPGVYSDTPTEFLLNPQVIFLPEPVEVETGRPYRISLSYLSGDSPLHMDIKVVPAG
jgi:predicted RNA methylase